jgi:hypothetical protein
MSLGKKKIQMQGAAGITATDHFAPFIYSGNSVSSRQITGLGFAPDLIWNKQRNGTTSHILTDTVRGVTKSLRSNDTAAEFSQSYYTSFDSDGWTFNNTAINTTGENFVMWCWKAGGAAVSNTDGTITSSVSANQDAGFSIVSYTGTGSNDSFGHGLSSAPEMVIIKSRDQSTRNWITHFTTLGAGAYMLLNGTNANATSTARINTTTSSVVNIGTSANVNKSGDNLIAYCFHSVDGYQKVGSYSGSNSPITITTGFQPRFVLIKRTDASGNSWVIIDSAREIGSGADALFPDLSAAESSSWNTDFISTGFTISSNESYISASGGTYIYLAIA